MFDFMDFDQDSPTEYVPSNGPNIPAAADCMRCGLCVGVCPTFKLSQLDGETPRRRIRTIEKLLSDPDSATTEELTHLDSCLQCRACEPACPSRMDYGLLFDQVQSLRRPRFGFWGRLAFKAIADKRLLRRTLPLVAGYLASGIGKPLRALGVLKVLGLADVEALVRCPVGEPLAERYPATGPMQGRVALFTGCLAEAFDRDTLVAAVELLSAIGYEVLVPPQQGCCGAIHRHNGQPDQALRVRNVAAFDLADVDAVIYTATGCGAMLSEYPDDSSLRLKLADIHAFLLEHWPVELRLRPAQRSVAVHEPCSQRNVLKNQQAVYQLLGKIPGLSVTALPDNASCCGAGGSYMLTHPQQAARLKALKHAAIDSAGADVVVSGNFGCALYLNAGQADAAPRIVHPLVVLAGQLGGDA